MEEVVVGGYPRADPQRLLLHRVHLEPRAPPLEEGDRALPGGGASDLVLVTTANGIAFFDGRAGVLAGSVEEVGSPSAFAVRQNGEGVRLYVPSFNRGTLAVVDVPDLTRPAGARVVAILGAQQEGAF